MLDGPRHLGILLCQRHHQPHHHRKRVLVLPTSQFDLPSPRRANVRLVYQRHYGRLPKRDSRPRKLDRPHLRERRGSGQRGVRLGFRQHNPRSSDRRERRIDEPAARALIPGLAACNIHLALAVIEQANDDVAVTSSYYALMHK